MCIDVPPELSSPVSFSAGTHYLDFINNNEPVVLAPSHLVSMLSSILDAQLTYSEIGRFFGLTTPH
ncbi:hypothetical protein Hypma_014225, partial [Hypsizygus marmoreus]